MNSFSKNQEKIINVSVLPIIEIRFCISLYQDKNSFPKKFLIPPEKMLSHTL